jgi:integrase
MLRELVKDKQPDDLIFTRGLNHRPVQRFDKLWRRGCRMAGVNESLLVHDLRRTAAQRMLDGRDSGAAHHANLRLEDHVDVPPLRDDGTQRAAAGTREARRV